MGTKWRKKWVKTISNCHARYDNISVETNFYLDTIPASFWLRKFVLSLTLNICGWWLFSCTLCYVDNYLFHVIIHLILCTHPHTKLNDPCSFNPFPSNSSGLRFRAEVRFCFCVTVTAYVLKQVLLYRQLQSVLMKLQLQDTIEIYIWLWLFLAKQRQ